MLCEEACRALERCLKRLACSGTLERRRRERRITCCEGFKGSTKHEGRKVTRSHKSVFLALACQNGVTLALVRYLRWVKLDQKIP